MPTTSTPVTEAALRVRRAVEAAKAPISLKALAKQTRVPDVELKAILAADLERRLIHRWPEVRGQQRFWGSSPEDVVRDRLLAVASECAIPASKLAAQAKKGMPAYPAKLIAAAVKQLLRDKELRVYSSFGKGGQLLGREGFPAAYAAAARQAIAAIWEKVAAAGAVSEQPTTETAILEAMARIEPSRTAPVSLRELRAALPHVPKPALDQAALALRQQRRIFLSRHDFPQSLSEEDRATLIDGQDGAFYVAITAREL